MWVFYILIDKSQDNWFCSQSYVFYFMHLKTLSWNFYFQEERINGLFPMPPAAAAAKSLQSCPTLCNPRDGSPPGSPVPGILQARTLEWVAVSFSSALKWKVKVKLLSRVWLLASSWIAAYQALPSMGFSRLEYWSGVPLSSPQWRLLGIKSFPGWSAMGQFLQAFLILIIPRLLNSKIFFITDLLQPTLM